MVLNNSINNWVKIPGVIYTQYFVRFLFAAKVQSNKSQIIKIVVREAVYLYGIKNDITENY